MSKHEALKHDFSAHLQQFFLMRQIHKPLKWKWLVNCAHLLVPAFLKVRCDSVLGLRHLFKFIWQRRSSKKAVEGGVHVHACTNGAHRAGLCAEGRFLKLCHRQGPPSLKNWLNRSERVREESQTDVLLKQCGLRSNPLVSCPTSLNRRRISAGL